MSILLSSLRFSARYKSFLHTWYDMKVRQYCLLENQSIPARKRSKNYGALQFVDCVPMFGGHFS